MYVRLQERRRDEARVREETRRRESEAVLSAVQHEMERPRGSGNNGNNGVHNGNSKHKSHSKFIRFNVIQSKSPKVIIGYFYLPLILSYFLKLYE